MIRKLHVWVVAWGIVMALGMVSGGWVQAAVLPPVSSVETNGPFATTIDKYTGPTLQAWVVRPSTLGSQGVSQHPIFIWGPGAGTGPSNYEDHLRRWASHGFVVYCIASTGDGSEMKSAIDWLITQNNRSTSRYYKKLLTSKIAVGGHSRGSLSAFGIAADSRLTTSIHIAGGSFDGNGPKNLRKAAMYAVGSADTTALSNVQRDYTNTTVPVWFGTMSGVDHIQAARQALPATTAWLRWHLAEETSRKSMFIGSGCYFCSGMWTVKYKNW
jgi:hypothetical protein